MKKIFAISLITSVFSNFAHIQPAIAQNYPGREILLNPNWTEVANTGIPNSPYEYNVLIDKNNYMRNGDRIIFDMSSTDLAYVQVQVNCKTKTFEQLRFGVFSEPLTDSMTGISFTSGSGITNLNSHRETILNFVCSQLR